MFKKYLFLCVLSAISWTLSYSQNMTFYHYGLNEGLSQQTVRCILKDSQGFLWLGTQDGLNRFDGHSFSVYKKRLKDSLTISGKFINDLIEAKDKTIWVATANNGLSYYNSDSDVFTRTNQLTGNCTSLATDSKGNVYAAFLNKGLIIFEKANAKYISRKIRSLPDNSLLSEIEIKDNKLYVGTTDGRLFYANLRDSKLTFQEISLPYSLDIIDELLTIDSNLLIGSSQGLFLLNIKTNNLISIPLKQYSDQLTKQLVIESITLDDETLYVGTDNGLFVLKRFNPSNGDFKELAVYKGDRENTSSITSNRVYDILIDNDLLWIGTNNLDVAYLKPPVFTTIHTKSTPAINNNYVFSILKTDNYSFIGTRDGLNCIDNKGVTTYITKENTDGKLAYNVIRGMAIDNGNNLWLATTKGVSVLNLNNFNPKAPEIVSIYSDPQNIKSLSNNKTRNIFIDKNNSVWVTTYGGGINRFVGDLKNKNYTFQRFAHMPNANSISTNFTFSMSQDAKGVYWITSENGLNKLEFGNQDYKSPKFTAFTYRLENDRGLQSNTTLHTYHDKDDQLWIATQNGLHKYNTEDYSFTHYNEDHGLTNTYVYSIQEDNQGFLWVSTNDGLFQFNKLNESFKQFKLKDGIQSTEFNLGAHFNDRDNNLLYFGGVNGFNVFNPQETKRLDTEGKLALTGLKINNKLINPIEHPRIISKSINKTQSIKLNHNDFPCIIQFSDLDIRPNKSNSFVYSLNNSEWNDIDDSQELRLLDLPKGNHELRLQGKNRNALWSSPPLILSIKVIPPWYKSNLAYLLYLGLFLGTVFMFYKQRLRGQLAQQESMRLKDLDELKSQFVTNITHEFRTPLTLISGHLDQLNEQSHSNSKVTIQAIKQNSNNLLHLVNEMLDLAKLDKGKLNLDLTQNDLVTYMDYIIQSFSSLAQSQDISLKFLTNCDTLLMDFDAERMRQILANLINNALKYSNNHSTITVRLNSINSFALIDIEDEGIGISETDLLSIFNRFYRSKDSAKQYSGSGVGLALTKQLVELMGGTILVHSQLGKGSTFTIRLPISTKAVKGTTSINNMLVQVPRTEVNLPKKNFVKTPNRNDVLIVEDNPDIAQFIASCLEQSYNITLAENGLFGFEKAQKSVPDIIITDLMMPKMDGFEFTQKLQETITTNHIPVIMLTAKAQLEDKLQGLKSGVDAYLTKPFEKEELQLRVETLITKRKQLQEKFKLKTVINLDKTELKFDKNLEFIEQVTNHVYKHIEESDYNAGKLAANLNMSESQLYRKLKAITNKSTAIFIRSIRLEKAKELLQNTSLNVSEVAYATGFSNPNWFGKAFKEEFGINPSEIRI